MSLTVLASRWVVPVGFALLGACVGVLSGIDPRLAVAAGIAIAFALLVLSDLFVGLILFTLVTFVAQVPEFFGSGVTFAKVAGLLLAVSWLAVVMARNDVRAEFAGVHPMITFAIVAFLGWMLCSQLWAENSGQAIDAAFRLFLNALLIFIVFSAVRTPKQAIGLVAAFVAGATFVAIYGIVFVTPEADTDNARLASGLDNPNELATVLVAAVALSLGLSQALREKYPLGRVAALVAGAICLAGVFLTGSRGGLVALAVALAAFLIVGRQFRGRLILLAVVVVAAGVTYYTYIASPEARERVTELDSGTGRTDLWVIGWRMVEAEPVHGVGAGNFTNSSASFLLTEPGLIERSDFVIGSAPKVAHNTYLHIWAELGTIGLLLLLIVMGFGLYAAAKATHAFGRLGDPRMEMIARAVFVALAAILAADFFGSRQYQKELWLLLGLAPALWAIARAHDEAGPARSG